MNTNGTLNLNVEVNGNSLLFLVWNSLYAEQLIPNLPLLIDQLAAGKTELFDSIALPFIKYALNGNSSETFGGSVFLTECIDGGRYIDNKDRALLNNPGIYSSLLLSIGIYCDGLGVTSAPK